MPGKFTWQSRSKLGLRRRTGVSVAGSADGEGAAEGSGLDGEGWIAAATPEPAAGTSPPGRH